MTLVPTSDSNPPSGLSSALAYVPRTHSHLTAIPLLPRPIFSVSISTTHSPALFVMLPRSNIRRGSKNLHRRLSPTTGLAIGRVVPKLYLRVSDQQSFSCEVPTVVSILAVRSTTVIDRSGCSVPRATILNSPIQPLPTQLLMYPPESLSPFLDPADYPPSHNVFFPDTRAILRLSQPPSRDVFLAITLAVSGSTHQVTMYSSQRPLLSQDPMSTHPPSRNAFLGIALTTLGPTQVTMDSPRYSRDPPDPLTHPPSHNVFSRSLSSPQDPVDHRSSHAVFFATTPPFRDPTDSNGISLGKPVAECHAFAHSRCGSVTCSPPYTL